MYTKWAEVMDKVRERERNTEVREREVEIGK